VAAAGVDDGGAVQRQRAGRAVVEVGAVLAGADGVAEGQRAGARAAGVGGAAAAAERQGRRAAAGVDVDRAGEIDRDGDGLAAAVGAVGGAGADAGDAGVGAVDIDAGRAADAVEGGHGVVAGDVLQGAAVGDSAPISDAVGIDVAARHGVAETAARWCPSRTHSRRSGWWLPTTRAMRGVPPVVSTMTASLKLTVKSSAPPP
jgi:hypothetical protein